MKKSGFLAVLCLLLTLPVAALGDIGFAEVKKDNVNMRREPGGKAIMQVDAPQSVFVAEEKQKDGYLWCHVYTIRGKNTEQGWIRGNMLRFVSDEFTDIVSVQAGNHYVTGVRRDGTVAILGDDMPHMPCIETVRRWRNVVKTESETCSVYALDQSGKVLSVGRNNQYGTWQAADISGNEPVLLDENGCILEDTWWNHDYLDRVYPESARGVSFAEVAPLERCVRAGLTREGQILCFGADASLAEAFVNGPYTDMDMYFYHLAALRADGKVDAAIRVNAYMPEESESACNVDAWENVIQVAAGIRHTLGLKADGTVYYAGDDVRHKTEVESWSGIVQIDAGNGYSIALKNDGSVVMAGAYKDYFR